MASLFLPALTLMLVTLVVWLRMFAGRFSAAGKLKIDPQDLSTPEKVSEAFDDKVNASSNCFKNLFELPVLFYVLCGFIAVAGAADSVYINLAWAFVGLRALQAIVHCTYNKVMHRFYAYFTSSIVLWVIAGRFFLTLF